MSIVVLILTTTAFLLLGLATDAQYRRRFGAGLSRQRRSLLRNGGWGVLIISIAPAILARGWIFGPILWIAAVMAGAGVAFLSLNLIVSQSPPR